MKMIMEFGFTKMHGFILEGDIVVNGQNLNKRDGYGIWETDSFTLHSNSTAKVLVMEVPMNS